MLSTRQGLALGPGLGRGVGDLGLGLGLGILMDYYFFPGAEFIENAILMDYYC